MQIHSVPLEAGLVRVRIVRDGQEVIQFATPQEITHSSLRTDRLTYSYSSAFKREFEQLFPLEKSE